MKRNIAIWVLIIGILCTGMITALSAQEYDPFFSIGKYYREYTNKTDSTTELSLTNENDLCATFRGKSITKATVEYQRNALGETTSNNLGQLTDYDIVNQIVLNYIMQDEAEIMGLTPSSEEIEAFVEDQKTIYENYPDAQKAVDQYCEGAQISLDEYFEIIKEHTSAIIAKQRLRDEIGKEYCEENGLEFTKFIPPPEMLDAIDAYLEELFLQYKDEIVYYIPIPE